MHKKIGIYTCILIGLLSVGCKKNVPPQVFIPLEAGEEYSTGDTVALDVTLVDDKALFSAEMKISHIDTLLVANNFNSIVSPLNIFRQYNISGNTAFINERIHIPDSAAAGDYRLTVNVVDEEGSQGFAFKNINIINRLDTIAPTMEIEIQDTFQIGNIPINVIFEDDQKLAAAQFQLRRKDSTNILSHLIWPLSQAIEKHHVHISVAEIGIYDIDITLRDWVNNIKKETFRVYIKD